MAYIARAGMTAVQGGRYGGLTPVCPYLRNKPHLRCLQHLTVSTTNQEKGGRKPGHWRAFPAFAGIAQFLDVDELTARRENGGNVVGDSPAELELLQVARLGIQYVWRDL
jgi:hypothetical protein